MKIESKYYTTENLQITCKREREEERNEGITKNSQKTIKSTLINN